jgi:hypothetical protein
MDDKILEFIRQVKEEIKTEGEIIQPPICPAPIPDPPKELYEPDNDVDDTDKIAWCSEDKIAYFEKKLSSLGGLIRAAEKNQDILNSKHVESILDLIGEDMLDVEIARYATDLQELFTYVLFKLKTEIRLIEDYIYDRE